MYPVLTDGEYIKIVPDGAAIVTDMESKLFRRAINETALSILQRCDGLHSVDDIVLSMSAEYGEDPGVAERLVRKFVNQSISLGTLRMNLEKSSRPPSILGSSEYWVPEVVILELTKRCLLKCKHCYANAGSVRAREMDFDILLKLYREMSKTGVSIIQLTGGEPLLYSRFPELLDEVAQDRTDLIVTTSGNYLRDDCMEALKGFPRRRLSVQISVDGFARSHDAIRGVESSYDNAIASIEQLVDLGCQVIVASTYLDQTPEEMDAFCGYIKGLGVTGHRIGLAIPKGRAVKNCDELTSAKIDEYNELVSGLVDKYDSPGFHVRRAENNEPIKRLNCGAGSRLLYVDSAFRFQPCPTIDTPFGAYTGEGDFLSLIQKWSRAFAAIQAPSDSLCGKCAKRCVCQNCMSQAVLYSGEVSSCACLNAELGKVLGSLHGLEASEGKALDD